MPPSPPFPLITLIHLKSACEEVARSKIKYLLHGGHSPHSLAPVLLSYFSMLLTATGCLCEFHSTSCNVSSLKSEIVQPIYKSEKYSDTQVSLRPPISRWMDGPTEHSIKEQKGGSLDEGASRICSLEVRPRGVPKGPKSCSQLIF